MLAVLGSFSKDISYSCVHLADIQTMTESDDDTIKSFGYFNLLCYQYEIEKDVQPDSQNEYNIVGTHLEKTLVKVFNRELKNWKLKVLSK